MEKMEMNERLEAGMERGRRPAVADAHGASAHRVTSKIQAAATAALTPRRKSVFRTRESIIVPPDMPVIRTAAPCPQWCGPCLYEKRPLPDEPTAWQGLVDMFRCPPHRYPAKLLYAVLVVSLIWIALWGMFDDELYPPGLIFTIFFVEVVAFIGGELIQIFRLPPLFGMLLTGIMLGNIPFDPPLLGSGENLKTTFYIIRSAALGIILTRAGLGLNPTALRRLSFVCFRLAFSPCLVESLSACIAAHFLLGMDWMWCFMLGFALAAVSPAVVVPGMLNVQKQNLSVEKGIPTLLIAASSIDDVLAIGGFGVCMSVTFTKENLLMSIFHGPIEVCLGIVYGTILGVLLWYFPDPLAGRPRYVAWLRMLIMLSGSMSGLFGARKIGYTGAGAMSCMVLAFVAAYNWREDISSSGLREISHQYARLWTIFQPLLFGLVGSEIHLKDMEAETIGYGIGVLAIGLTCRSITAFTVVWGCDFTWKERLFIAMAWLPKATVQAAMGPVALDHVRANNIEGVEETYAKTILHITALAILISAPLGAICIAVFAPILLTHDEPQEPSHQQLGTATESESKLIQDMMMKSQEHHLRVPDVVESKDDRVSSLIAVSPGQEYREFLTGLSEHPPPPKKKGRMRFF